MSSPSTPEIWRSIEEKLGMTGKDQNGFIFRVKREDVEDLDEEFVFRVDDHDLFGVFLMRDGKISGWIVAILAKFTFDEIVEMMVQENKQPETLSENIISHFSKTPISKKSKTIEHKGWYLQVVGGGCVWNVSRNFAWGTERWFGHLWFSRAGDLIDLTCHNGGKVLYSFGGALMWFWKKGYSIKIPSDE